MTDVTVTDEMVEAGRSAIQDRWDSYPDRYAREIAQAVITAALPLVVERERERAARIAERCAFDGVDVDEWAIAAAIRSDKGGETGDG